MWYNGSSISAGYRRRHFISKAVDVLMDRKRTIAILYEKYYRELLHYSFSLFQFQPQYLQEAEDCVQDAFEKALTRVPGITGHPAPLPLLKKMCRNIAITRRRNLMNRAHILGFPVSVEEQQNLPGGQDEIALWIHGQENLEAKQLLLRLLTEGERDVYRVFYEMGKSIRDTAGELNITEGSVRGCLQRIRRKAEKLKFI